MREIRNLYRFIPFGKFSLSGRGKPPFNQVFVGREKERADFIELLTHQESFGAFLISGQRGVGKTSFVEYCLDEYEEMSFQRSIRVSRNTGFFGLFLLLAFSFVLVSTFVLLTQFLELSAQNVFEAIMAEGVRQDRGVNGLASASTVWLSIPLIIGTGLMALPIVFAYRTVTALTELCDSASRRYLHYVGNLVAVLSVVIAWPIATFIGHALNLDIILNVDVILYVFLWVVVPLSAYVKVSQTVFQNKKYSLTQSQWANRLSVFLAIFSGLIALLNLRGDESGSDLSDLLLLMVVYGFGAFGWYVWVGKLWHRSVGVLSILVAFMSRK